MNPRKWAMHFIAKKLIKQFLLYIKESFSSKQSSLDDIQTDLAKKIDLALRAFKRKAIERLPTEEEDLDLYAEVIRVIGIVLADSERYWFPRFYNMLLEELKKQGLLDPQPEPEGPGNLDPKTGKYYS